MLPADDPAVTYVLDVSPGEEFSMGSMYIRDPDEVGVEIVEVHALASANVEFLGSVAVLPRDQGPEGMFGGGPGFPPPELPAHHEAVGLVVPPEEFHFVPKTWDGSPPLQVMVGFRIVDGDIGAANGVTVVYRAGGKTHRAHFREAIIACVKPRTCDVDDINFEEKALRDLGLLNEDALRQLDYLDE